MAFNTFNNKISKFAASEEKCTSYYVLSPVLSFLPNLLTAYKDPMS